MAPAEAVIGAGLKNEIRAVMSGRSWGTGVSCDANFFNGSCFGSTYLGPESDLKKHMKTVENRWRTGGTHVKLGQLKGVRHLFRGP